MNEARTVIELGRGDLFFNMSAFFGHKNGSIVGGGTRRSIVFYTAAELFRWVNQGQRLRPNRAQALSEQGIVEEEDSAEDRFQEGLRRLGHVSRLGLSMDTAI